jgi:hypothetical protein
VQRHHQAEQLGDRRRQRVPSFTAAHAVTLVVRHRGAALFAGAVVVQRIRSMAEVTSAAV